MPWYKFLLWLLLQLCVPWIIAENGVCPGGKQSCPSDQTCCSTASGVYGCCAFPNATCCEDGEHCCPEGFTCDGKTGICRHSGAKASETSLVALPYIAPVTCPGGKMTCADNNTCCKTDTGTYACCPLPNAVCCDDGEHCCPSGMQCDLVHQVCIRSSLQFFLGNIKHHQEWHPLKARDIVCPDKQRHCRSGSTCCKDPFGDWGCCPLTSAVCCDDGVHCCPQGSKCDTAHERCQQGNLSLPWVKKDISNHVR